MAVAVFKQPDIIGEAVATTKGKGTLMTAKFTKLPPGKHGFHIHVAGDLRGEGCAGACAHLHVGSPVSHGGRPGAKTRRAERHSGDLGNIVLRRGQQLATYKYYLPDLKPADLWGRTLIIHADEDDLGKGNHEDSKTTGHSGARIGCAIFGRLAPCAQKTRTRKQRGGTAFEVAYAQVLGGNNSSPTKLSAEVMSSQPEIKVMNIESSSKYAILMYDPDAVGSTPGSKANYLHYLKVNSNSVCVPYKGPSPPPGSGVHRYTFILYKQSRPINCLPVERTPFDLSAFVTRNGLTEIQKTVFEVSSAS